MVWVQPAILPIRGAMSLGNLLILYKVEIRGGGGSDVTSLPGGNQAAHASVAGVLPGPRFWGDIVDACELLVDHRVDNPLYDPGRGTRLPQRCRLAVCGSCGHLSARIRHCPGTAPHFLALPVAHVAFIFYRSATCNRTRPAGDRLTLRPLGFAFLAASSGARIFS